MIRVHTLAAELRVEEHVVTDCARRLGLTIGTAQDPNVRPSGED